jgi:hypothetical protein
VPAARACEVERAAAQGWRKGVIHRSAQRRAVCADQREEMPGVSIRRIMTASVCGGSSSVIIQPYRMVFHLFFCLRGSSDEEKVM